MVTHPEDWKDVQLKDIGYIQMCRRIFQDQTKKSGQIPFYKIGTFGGKADAYISRELFEQYRNMYPYPAKGDVLLSAAGTVGKTVIFDGRESYFQDSNIVWLKVDESEIDRKFLYYFYKSFPWKALEGTTIGRLYNNIILNTDIHLPSFTEQQAIASALSDFDEHIDNLTELIEKKKAIRDGALEDLINGETRLDGFRGDWNSCKINDVADFFDNLRIPVTKNQRMPGNTPYYGANGIQDYVSGYTHNGEFILIAEDGANDLLNYPITYASGKIWVNNHAHVLAGIKSVADTKFLSYLLKKVDYTAVLVGGTRAKLNGKTLKNIEITLPESISEQQAIAQVLSAMDEEIESLEVEKEKMLQIKEGAMDDLLTGRVRLKV